MNFLWPVIVSVFFLAGSVRAASDFPPGRKKITVTVYGDVRRKGKVELHAPARIDDAFQAAGGFRREEGARRNRPATFCILMTRAQGVDENMHVAVKVDGKTGIIRVTDPAWVSALLKDGDTVIVPVVVR